MIPNGEGWHYLAVKNKLELHKKVYEYKDFCNIVIPSEETKILEFNQCYKYDKVSFIMIYDVCRSCLKVMSAAFLLVCFACLKESTCKTRKSVIYFTPKALFILLVMKFGQFT